MTRLSRLQIAIKLFLLAGNAYGLSLAIFLVAKYLIGEQWDMIGLGNSYLHLLIMPTFGLLPIYLLKKGWRQSAIFMFPVLFFIASYGNLFLPRKAKAAQTGTTIKFLTYNMHSERQLLDPMVALIRESDADVIGLQELSVDAGDRFAAEFADVYPYQALHTRKSEPVIGQGVLSRFPILKDEYWRNDSLPVRLAHQRVEIDVKGTHLTFYNTHPSHPLSKAGRLYYGGWRAAEIDSVLDRAKRDSGPVIIAGDFNMSDQSEDYQRITAYFADSYREVGWGMGFTFPDFHSRNALPRDTGPLPLPLLVRLDYIFHSDAIQVIEAHVWHSSGGSDHRPVFAQLSLQ